MSETETKIMKPSFYCGSRVRQYYSAFSVCLAVTSVGAAWSWTATAIPSLNKTASFGPLTKIEEAWITSMVFLGAILVCPLSGFTMQKLGLKTSMLTLTLPLVGGWILITFSTNVWMILIGRFVTGFCAGGISLAVPVFIAETTEVEIRGKLGFGYDLMGSVGQLYIYVVGYYVSWEWQAVACGIIPIIFHVLLMFVPESPRTLISRNKMEEAKKSLAWFRHASSLELILPEFNSILDDIELSKVEKQSLTTRDYFTSPILRPTLIGVVLMFFLQVSGAIPILSYTVDIFETAGTDNSSLATILVGITQVVAAMIASFFVDRFGRRILLMVSAIFMAIPLAMLGSYHFWQSSLENGWNWLPVFCLIWFIAAFSVGFGPVPWIVMGELVPSATKGFSSAIVTFASRSFAFLVVFFFKDIINLIGQHGCYWLFSGFCLLAIVYVYFRLPETKGKSLAEIQLYFLKKEDTEAEKSNRV